MRVLALLLGLLCAASVLAVAGGGDGAYDSTAHADPVSGVLRRPDVERGDCGHCHYAHASEDGQDLTPHAMLLFAANDDSLCFACHSGEGAHKVYAGQGEATANAHATSPVFRWPGPDPPARPGGDEGKCLNCHDPHGARDVTGVVPAMNVVREENECLTCHDANGPAGDDIQRELQRNYRHPVSSFSGRHAVDEGGDAGAFQGNRRHAECEDCHNPHTTRERQGQPQRPNAGEPLRGVPYLEVSNGGAGTQPNYTWRDGTQALVTPPPEYGVCFRCHSGWSQFAGEDLGVRCNPNNPSYHPIEAVGRDPKIPAGAFVNGVNANTVLLCSDCHHSSDSLAPAGPHGSDERALLAAWYPDNSQKQTMPQDALCFHCHRYDTYANDNAPESVRQLSRWNKPAFGKGHTYHVGKKQYPCSACHAVHGSTSHPSLIETGHNPGLNSYSQNATGGVCGPTCHGGEDYKKLNYSR